MVGTTFFNCRDSQLILNRRKKSMAQISKEVYEKLKKELNKLKEQRKVVAEKIKKAITFGDLSENFEYHEAKEEKQTLEKKIFELEQKIREAEIVKESPNNKIVRVYSRVLAKEGAKQWEFTIVSPEEINIKEGKISAESPVGKALLGKKEGDVVTVYGSDKTYKIVNIQ